MAVSDAAFEAVKLFVLLLPLYAPLVPAIEGLLLPVTGKITFVDERFEDGSTILRMQFTKNRDCEFLGVSVDRDGKPLDFAPVDGWEPVTIASGPRLSRPWRLGTTDLTGIRVRWVHRCNPFWTTVTVGYP